MIDLQALAKVINRNTNYNVSAKVSGQSILVKYCINVEPRQIVKRLFSAEFLERVKIEPIEVINKWLLDEYDKWFDKYAEKKDF